MCFTKCSNCMEYLSFARLYRASSQHVNSCCFHTFALYCQSLDKTVRYWHAVYIVCMWYLRVWSNKSSEFDVLFLFCFIFLLIAVWDMSTSAGYTPQDNRGDFGPISPLPTILGIMSGGSKDYFIRFSCGVRCIKSDWFSSEKNGRGAPM